MKITFVLPGVAERPSGGYKVVVDYANMLVERGHVCTLVLPVWGCRNEYINLPGPRDALWLLRSAARAGFGLPWATVSPGVRVRTVPVVSPSLIPAGDVTVATAWPTAPTVFHAPDRCGSRLYFIQHYETWSAPLGSDVVQRTWQLPMRKAVIARWLLELAESFGEGDRTDYTPNGLDLSQFRVMTPIQDRDPRLVGLLAHPATWKGTEIGLRAAEIARAQVPDLRLCVYGAGPRPLSLESWIEYSENLQGGAVPQYFNQLAIFLHPSLTEGWGLPPAEAMACGAAVICADNPGVLDYAVEGRNAAVVPRDSAEAMAQAIVRLVRDPHERMRLAAGGNESMQSYSLATATDRFERVLLRVAGRA